MNLWILLNKEQNMLTVPVHDSCIVILEAVCRYIHKMMSLFLLLPYLGVGRYTVHMLFHNTHLACPCLAVASNLLHISSIFSKLKVVTSASYWCLCIVVHLDIIMQNCLYEKCRCPSISIAINVIFFVSSCDFTGNDTTASELH